MSLYRVVLTILVSLSVAISERHAHAEPPVYKVAVIIPLSGQAASLASYVKRGIDLSFDSLPSESRAKIRLTYEDDQFDPVKTLSSYRRLLATEGVDAVFVVGSPSANALGPLAERDRKILIAIGASDPSIAVGKTYSFIHWVIPQVLGKLLASQLIKQNYRRIGFVSAEVSGAIADMEATIAALREDQGANRVAYQATFPKGEMDYRAAVQQLRQRKVDATVAVLIPGALSSFAKQFRKAGVSSELVGMETFEDEHEVRASQGALEGAWYVNASDAAEWFIERYRAKYGEHPGWAAANGYDAMSHIAEAISHGAKNSDEVRDYLRSIKDYSGASGVYSASGDNRFTLPAALKRVEKGNFVPLDR